MSQYDLKKKELIGVIDHRVMELEGLHQVFDVENDLTETGREKIRELETEVIRYSARLVDKFKKK